MLVITNLRQNRERKTWAKAGLLIHSIRSTLDSVKLMRATSTNLGKYTNGDLSYKLL